MKEVRANRLVVEDSNGTDRIVLALDEDENPSIIVKDRSGVSRFTIEFEEGEEVFDVRLMANTGPGGTGGSLSFSSDGEATVMLHAGRNYKAEIGTYKMGDAQTGTTWGLGLMASDESK